MVCLLPPFGSGLLLLLLACLIAAAIFSLGSVATFIMVCVCCKRHSKEAIAEKQGMASGGEAGSMKLKLGDNVAYKSGDEVASMIHNTAYKSGDEVTSTIHNAAYKSGDEVTSTIHSTACRSGDEVTVGDNVAYLSYT